MADSLTAKDERSTRRKGLYTVILSAIAAALFIWAAFRGAGGLSLDKVTTVWVVFLPLSTALIAFSIYSLGIRQLDGWQLLVLASLYLLLVGISISWSLTPDLSWQEFNRNLVYFVVLVAGFAAVRLWSDHWPALLYVLLLTVAVVILYALLTKVAPGWLAADETYGRLRAPFSYWNAVGITAAIGIPLAFWLTSASEQPRLLRASAPALIGVCTVALMMSYSRGALVAAVAAVIASVALLGRERLKAVAVLLLSVALSVPFIAWMFTQSELTEDKIALSARKDAGIEFGLLLLALLTVLFVCGLLIEWAARNKTPSQSLQRLFARGVVSTVVLIPLLLVAALALSNKGFGGSIDSAWNSLTSESAEAPSNAPGRFTSAASFRSHYWRESVRIWRDHRYKGAGAGSFEVVRLRYRRAPILANHAHGQIVQTLADLGLAGIFLLLAAAAAWLLAAARTLRSRAERAARSTAERRGLTCAAVVVATFAFHSLIDWTWYVPGIVLPTLFSAGWIAGRGCGDRASEPNSERRYRSMQALAVLAVGLVATWVVLLPWRSDRIADKALELAEAKNFTEAEKTVREANDLNPTALKPYFTLSAVEQAAGNLRAGEQALEQAVQLQPANPEAWRKLGEYELLVLPRPEKAQSVLGRAVLLDPLDFNTTQLLLQAQRATDVAREKERRARRILKAVRKKRREAREKRS